MIISLPSPESFRKWRRVPVPSMVLLLSTTYIALYVLDTMGRYPVNPIVLTSVAIFAILTALRTAIVPFMLSETPLCRQHALVCRLMAVASTSLANRARNVASTWRLRGYPAYTIPTHGSWTIPKHAHRVIRGDVITAIWRYKGYWFSVSYGFDKYGTIHVGTWIGDGSRSYEDMLRVIDFMCMDDVRKMIRRANAIPLGQK
jgi:hypothetical protein